MTPKGDELARRGLELTGLAKYLPVVISADSVTKYKPEPEPVLLALERLGIGADEALMMGDSPHDISLPGNASAHAVFKPHRRQKGFGASVSRARTDRRRRADLFWMNNISELPRVSSTQIPLIRDAIAR